MTNQDSNEKKFCNKFKIRSAFGLNFGSTVLVRALISKFGRHIHLKKGGELKR